MKPKFHTFDPEKLTVQEMHGYLLTAVAPRPIAFASTIDNAGNVNLSPFSFFNVFSANPPIMVFSPSRRGRDNTTKHTFDNIKEVPETVISIVNHRMVEQMSLASTEYAKGVNEFDKAGFTQRASETVRPPGVEESPVSFECSIDQVIELGDQGGAGNLVIARVKKMHIREEYLKADGKLDPAKLDLVGRMGEDWYCHAGNESMFELSKPTKTHGVGVDQLSQGVRNSPILDPNHLGRMGNLERLPTKEEVFKAKESDEIREILCEFEMERDLIKDAIHELGKKMLNEGKTFEALTAMMVVDHI
jgi:flavin reductase (DIM6/NTAB) family NADH-FMN oxidoreductase RutF